jgi:hypothetical protein
MPFSLPQSATLATLQAQRRSGSRSGGDVAGLDDNDAVRSVWPVLLERGASLDYLDRGNLVATERRDLIARVSHAIDNEEQRDLRNSSRKGGREGRRRRLWRYDPAGGAGGCGGCGG